MRQAALDSNTEPLAHNQAESPKIQSSAETFTKEDTTEISPAEELTAMSETAPPVILEETLKTTSFTLETGATKSDLVLPEATITDESTTSGFASTPAEPGEDATLQASGPVSDVTPEPSTKQSSEDSEATVGQGKPTEKFSASDEAEKSSEQPPASDKKGDSTEELPASSEAEKHTETSASPQPASKDQQTQLKENEENREGNKQEPDASVGETKREAAAS